MRVSATVTATMTVAAATRPICARSGTGVTTRAASAIATVVPATTTAEPAVPTACAIESVIA